MVGKERSVSVLNMETYILLAGSTFEHLLVTGHHPCDSADSGRPPQHHQSVAIIAMCGGAGLAVTSPIKWQISGFSYAPPTKYFSIIHMCPLEYVSHFLDLFTILYFHKPNTRCGLKFPIPPLAWQCFFGSLVCLPCLCSCCNPDINFHTLVEREHKGRPLTVLFFSKKGNGTLLYIFATSHQSYTYTDRLPVLYGHNFIAHYTIHNISQL